MLWDIIRDFLVQYIFGGCDSHGSYYWAHIGSVVDGGGNIIDGCTTADTYLKLHGYTDVTSFDFDYISMGDWLSTTATIIILCLVILFFIKLTIWFFKQGAGLFKW